MTCCARGLVYTTLWAFWVRPAVAYMALWGCAGLVYTTLWAWSMRPAVVYMTCCAVGLVYTTPGAGLYDLLRWRPALCLGHVALGVGYITCCLCVGLA